MNDFLSQPVIALITAMILTECTEISPWLARRILRTAARRIGNQEAAERYEEEWLSLLEERPGKILKLFSAAWIALRATWTLRAIHHSQGPTTAGRANGLVSWLIRPHHSRITVPEGYALASGGRSRWTVREGRANRNPSHLRLLVCLSVPQLLVPLYVLLASVGAVPRLSSQVAWIVGVACYLGGCGSLVTMVCLAMRQTCSLTLTRDDGRSVTLSHMPLWPAFPLRRVLGLTFGPQRNARITNMLASASITLNTDVVPVSDPSSCQLGHLSVASRIIVERPS